MGRGREDDDGEEAMMDPSKQGRLPLTKTQWIEKYGGQQVIDAEGFVAAPPAFSCDDTICHGWRVVPRSSLMEVAR